MDCAEVPEDAVLGCRGRLPGRSTEEACREAEEEKEEKGQRNIRHEIAQKVMASIKEKAGQKVKQGWDCSKIGNEEEEEEEVWQEKNQMTLQWAEDEKLDVMQKAPESVVHDRMAQGEKVTGAKVKKQVKGWSTEEMKDQSCRHLEEDTKEMRTWRSLKREEIDQCWKKLAKKSEEEVLDKYRVEDSKREAYRGRGAPLEWRRVHRKQQEHSTKWRDDCWARIFALFREYNLQRRQSMHEDSTEKEEMRRQQRKKVMKDMMKKIRLKGQMDATNRWWVAELLAADCEKAWSTQKKKKPCKNGTVGWKNEKEDDRRKMEELHQQRVNQMIKSASLLHKITKPTARKGGTQILKKEEDARLLDRCEAKKIEWAKHWQCDEGAQQVEDELWKNEELKEIGGSIAKAKRW